MKASVLKFETRGMLKTSVVVGMVFLVLALFASEALAAEKLVLGFEKNIDVGKKLKPLKLAGGDVTQGTKALSWDGKKNWKWRMRPGKYEKGWIPGDWPAVSTADQKKRKLSGLWILNSFGWFPKHCPTDWTGFDLLRVDVKSTVQVKMRICIEDLYTEPWLGATYDVPAGKWVTLDMNIAKAAKERSFDFKHIASLLLVGIESPKPPQILVDNIRLATKGASAKHVLL